MSKRAQAHKKNKYKDEYTGKTGPKQSKGSVGKIKNNQDRNKINNRIRSGYIYDDF